MNATPARPTRLVPQAAAGTAVHTPRVCAAFATLLGVLALVLSAVPGLPSPIAVEADDTQQWMQEFLLQLSELRKSQGELKATIDDLKARLDELEQAATGAAAQPLALSDLTYPPLGAADAGVAIVEFSDFQCPFCRRHQQTTLPALAREYLEAGKVQYRFVDFPLNFHAQAESAAIAATCAHRQGAFWPMHDALFENQNKLGRDTYLQLASTLKLERDAFLQCLDDPSAAATVRTHASFGDRMGVEGTPAFLLGRVHDGTLEDIHELSGAQPLANFERVLDSLLKTP